MSALQHINEFWQTFFKKIKNFLFSHLFRELLVFLIFLFIAFAFWFIRVLYDDYVIELPVNVQMINVPKNVIITQDAPRTLIVKVRDKGTTLLNYKFGADLSPIVIDFSKYNPNTENEFTVSSSDLEKYISTQLIPSTKIISIRADHFTIIYSKGSSKSLPIKIVGNIQPAQQYYISDTIITPNKIQAFAPQSILNNLKVVCSQPLYRKDINKATTCYVKLQPVPGVKFIPSVIKVDFRVDIYTEKQFVIPLHGTNFPKGIRLLTFPSKVTVSCQVSSALFKHINESDFSIDIPYEDIITSNADNYLLHLTKFPDGIRNVHITPNRIDFLLEQNNHGN